MAENKNQMIQSPYWWEAAKPELFQDKIPASKVDVTVIGGGYTGLSAALTLAKAGSSVVVVEAECPGYGASSRNGGMIGYLLKPGLDGLIETYGLDRGKGIYQEAITSVDFVDSLIKQEQIDCDLNMNGRFYPAVLDKHLKSMAAEHELREKYFGLGEEIVGRDGSQEDVKSDLYVGGLRQHGTGSLDPAKFVKGLASAVRKNGGTILAPCRANKIERKQSGFAVQTSMGEILSSEVLIATNGYSSELLPFVQRRVIPIASTMIATEELSVDHVKSLIPNLRMITDTRKMLSYYRPSPDGRRILLGGRPTAFKAPIEVQAKALHSRLTEIFPSLSSAVISHVWSGNVAYSFEALPSIGNFNGIHYAMAYCGSGVAMSGYLGHKSALKILGSKGSETAFDDLPFSGRFYYNGHPWFLPVAMIGYKLRDHFGF